MYIIYMCIILFMYACMYVSIYAGTQIPADPAVSPSKLETHETAKFTCTHTPGFPVHWNISSQVPINPMHENGTEVSTLTIESVSPGMNLTKIQCWQNMFGSVVYSETATLIVLGESS